MDFVAVTIWYCFAFLGYVALIFQADYFPKYYFYLGAIVLAVICFIELPFLSNDYFRFLWDGEMIHLGINPYDFSPDHLIHSKDFNHCYYLDLYAGMGELSRSNYSCYPTFNQLYFYLSTGVYKDIWTNVLLLRIFSLGTILIAVFYLEKLLIEFNLNPKRSLVFLLNPLVIIESVANLHYELPMVGILIISLYFLLKNKLLISGVLFAISVHVKLIPLLLLPFFLSFLGWKKSIKYYSTVGITTILLFLVFIHLDNYENFLLSLRLYFKEFEFNSFLLYPYIQYGMMEFGWNLTSLYAPKLAKITLVLILGIAWHRKSIDKSEMIRRILLGIMAYYFFTSTIHPWYWILPLGISLLHFSWSIILITLFAILSYGIYSFGNDSDYRIVLEILNLGTVILFFWEYFKPQKFDKFLPKIVR